VPRWTQIDFSDSATRHRISPERAAFVVERASHESVIPAARDPEWNPERLLFLGFDENGVALEVIGVDAGEGRLVILHAMKMRRRYEARLREALRP
jgi:hypothetical protein